MARPVQSKRLKYSREVKLTGCEAFAGESLNCTRCLAFPVILALTEVWAESRGVVAIPALTGFKSTYVMHFNSARSSSSACDLKRPCQNRPAQSSSRFAHRASGSFIHRMYQLILQRRSRHFESVSALTV